MSSHRLGLVHAEPSASAKLPEVSVELALVGEMLEASFEVRGQAPRANSELPSDSSSWGLWDWDVVELFVRANADSTYYEFQVSPLNQYFELEIFEPRKRVNSAFASGLSHATRPLGADSWAARLRIPLSALRWDGQATSIVGGAFAILGAPGARSYWSLFLPKQEVPDFHLPQYFRSLLPA